MKFFIYIGILSATLLVASDSFAQNRPLERAKAERNQLFRAEPVATEETAEEAKAAAQEKAIEAADATPLGVDLKAVRLIAHQDQVEESAEAGNQKIEIDSTLHAPEGLRESIESFLDKPVSMRLLAELSRDVIQAWRDSDYPLVDVYFPPQNITEGKIQMVVREAVLGEKSVTEIKHSKSDYLLSQLRVERGDRINRKIVESDLDWINENPIRQVLLVYEKGAEDGTSDIVLDVTESNPFSVYGGLANTGVNLTGEEEWSFGFNWMNPLQTEQSIGYHFTTDLDGDSLESQSLFYQKYLPWRHIFQVLAAHVTTDAATPLTPATPININGISKQVSLEYRIPLPRVEWNRKYRHYMTTAFDYKSTNTDLLFGGTSFFANEIEIGQVRFEYEGEFPDTYGSNRFKVGMTGSPSDLFGNNNDRTFDLARAGSTADYWYGFAELEKTLHLPGDLLFSYRGIYQVTPDRLASTEALLAGGYRTVRGFDESLTRGDSGIINSLEIISPSFSMLGHLGPKEEVQDQWNAFIFHDSAFLKVSDADAYGEVSPFLQSAGLGLKCRIGEKGFGRISYGWALDSHGVDPTEVNDGKLHFGFSLRH